MENDYYKLEAAICARNSGNLDPEGWAHSHILAIGFSSRRNPLGAAILSWMERETERNALLLRFLLSGAITRQEVAPAKESVDVANDAMRWFQRRHCPNCGGRGVLNFEQAQCLECGGTGERHRPSQQAVSDAVGIMYGALDYLEGQMRARLRVDSV